MYISYTSNCKKCSFQLTKNISFKECLNLLKMKKYSAMKMNNTTLSLLFETCFNCDK